MDEIIRVSKSGRYQLRKQIDSQNGGQFIIEFVACYGAYPSVVRRFPDSHHCSESSWECAAMSAFRAYENI